MCAAPAADNEFMLQLHRVHLKSLVPGAKYIYRVAGSDRQYSFIASPQVQRQHKFTFAAYGDLGDPIHSRAKSPGSAATLRTLSREVDDLDLILHVGDISYANGDPDIWDSFMDSIEPIASCTPYMIAVGNHEYDYLHGDTQNDPSGGKPYDPSWGNYGHDSGGECGVMTARRFYSPASRPSDNPPFWYGFDYGSAHFAVISTEHDLSHGSRQYQWLEEELASVDRCVTPWLILLLHRPMYVVYPHKSNRDVGEHIQASLEDLLERYRVDATIAGHVHSYYRTCPVYGNTCTDVSDYGAPASGAAASSPSSSSSSSSSGVAEGADLQDTSSAAAACEGAACDGTHDKNSSSSGWDAQGLAAARKLLYSSDTNRHKHGIVHFVIGSAGHKLSMVERGQEEWCQEAFETWGYVRFTVEGPETLVAEFVESETGRVLDQVTVRPSPFRKQECGGR